MLHKLTVRGSVKFMRITRVRLSNGMRVVGVKVPSGYLLGLKEQLAKEGVKMDTSAAVHIDLVEQDAKNEAAAAKPQAGAAASADASGAEAGKENGEAAAPSSGSRKRKL